ncbi:hypothetical protein FZC79_22150 [Rossellomorea vietnamensis]|uniref:Haemolysin-type calcium binding-related domain-containing protein n=1 Tax=Rossellomorea vietnamensis TaxID=218284 RepID=A0A5D4K5S0_9BACI|nr:hypothetical protein [Rossellomorea vietnamensis]TYR72634.1 hypothetical protein FZC79_22150 [Rossellomorea vietnamensis]
MKVRISFLVMMAFLFIKLPLAVWAAPNDGIYIGGEVKKYYALIEFMNEDSLKKTSEMNTAGLKNVYLYQDGYIASALDILYKDGLSNAQEEYHNGFLNDLYIRVDGSSYSPEGQKAGEKKLEDEAGNEYLISGEEGVIDHITIVNDDSINIDEVLNSEASTTSISAPIKINFGNEGGSENKVSIKTSFHEQPDKVLLIDKETNVKKWTPFINDENTNETTFYLNESTTILPIKNKVESTFSTASLKEYDKAFNILKNENLNLKVELSYFKNNKLAEIWDGSDGLPELFYEVKKSDNPKQVLWSKEIDYKDMLIQENFPESGAYIIEIKEKDYWFDDSVWEQEVFIENESVLFSDSEIQEMAQTYAPILLRHKEEEYYPVSLKYIFNDTLEENKLGNIQFTTIFGGVKVPFEDLGKFMPYNGHSESLMDMKSSNVTGEKSLSNLTGSAEESVVYYSYLERGDQFYINYHFLYPFDPKTGNSTDPSTFGHNFDRESVSLVFNKDTKKPTRLVYGAHMEGQPIHLATPGLFNDQEWSSGRVSVPFDQNLPKYHSHPILAMAKGAHALYPVSGNYQVYGISSEPAGITSLEDFESALSNLLLPEEMDIRSNRNYKLLSMNLNNLTSNLDLEDELSYNSFLTFSGEWVDVKGPANAKFPPFTAREKHITEWTALCTSNSDPDECAHSWEWNNIPELAADITNDVEQYFDEHYSIYQGPQDDTLFEIPSGLIHTKILELGGNDKVKLHDTAIEDTVLIKQANSYDMHLVTMPSNVNTAGKSVEQIINYSKAIVTIKDYFKEETAKIENIEYSNNTFWDIHNGVLTIASDTYFVGINKWSSFNESLIVDGKNILN